MDDLTVIVLIVIAAAAVHYWRKGRKEKSANGRGSTAGKHNTDNTHKH